LTAFGLQGLFEAAMEASMQMHPDKVYLARTPIDRAEAPFATYRALAQRTLVALRRSEPLMPLCRLRQENGGQGYYKRYRRDGSAVSWQLDRVNSQRLEDGLKPIPYDTADV